MKQMQTMKVVSCKLTEIDDFHFTRNGIIRSCKLC